MTVSEYLDFDAVRPERSSHRHRIEDIIREFCASGQPFARIKHEALGVTAAGITTSLYKAIKRLELGDCVRVVCSDVGKPEHKVYLKRVV